MRNKPAKKIPHQNGTSDSTVEPYLLASERLSRASDRALDEATNAGGIKASLDKVLPQWKALFKNIVLPVFLGMCSKLLREWLGPGISTDVLSRLEGQLTHLTGPQRRARLGDVQAPSADMPIGLLMDVLDVIAHIYAVLQAPWSDSTLDALHAPLERLNQQLAVPDHLPGEHSLARTLRVAVPGLLRFLIAANEGKTLPDEAGIQDYLQHFMSVDNQQIMQVLLPPALQWLPDFLWGWGALARDLVHWTNDIRQADLGNDPSLDPLGTGLEVLRLALRSPLGHLVLDRLKERFPALIEQVQGAQAHAEAVVAALTENAQSLAIAAQFLRDLANAADALLKRPAFPFAAPLSEQLEWGFAFLHDPLIQPMVQLLLPTQLAGPIRLAADIGASMATLAPGTSYPEMVRHVMARVENSPERDTIHRQLPVPMATLIQGFDYWQPLVAEIAVPGDKQTWEHVSAIGLAILQIVARQAVSYVKQAKDNDSLINDVILPVATIMCFLTTGRMPTSQGELAKLVIEQFIQRLFPGLYTLWNRSRWLLSLMTYLGTLHDAWHIYSQPASVHRTQALLEYAATVIGDCAWLPKPLQSLTELMVLLPPLLTLVSETADSDAQESNLEYMASVIGKLHDSSNPLVQHYVRRIKILLVCNMTGLSEALIGPYIPQVRDSDSDLDRYSPAPGQKASDHPQAAQFTAPTAPQTLGDIATGARNLMNLVVPRLNGRKWAVLLGMLAVDIGPAQATMGDPGNIRIEPDELASMAGTATPSLIGVENLEQRNARANRYIYAGAGALGGALLMFSLAAYWYYSQRTAPPAADSASQSFAVDQPGPSSELEATEQRRLIDPICADGLTPSPDAVYGETVEAIPPPTLFQRLQQNKTALAITGGALAAVIGASLVAYGVYSRLSDEDISSLLAKPVTDGPPLIDEVMTSLAEQFDEIALWETHDGLEKAILELGLDAGYVPSAEELQESPLLQALLTSVGGTDQHRARNKRSTTATELVETSGGTSLVTLSEEEHIRLTDIARVGAMDIENEAIGKVLVGHKFDEFLDSKPRLPGHLSSPQDYAAHKGAGLYEKYKSQIPVDAPQTYNAERLREVNVQGTNKDSTALALNVLTLGISNKEASAARARNPYQFEGMVARDGRWTINDRLHISENDLLMGKLQEKTGALLSTHTSEDTTDSTHVIYPEPKGLFRDMVATDLEADYIKDLVPVFAQLRPQFETLQKEKIRAALATCHGITGYDPMQRLANKKASLHDVNLHEDPRLLGLRRRSDTLRNVVGFVDAEMDFQFLLFLDTGGLVDMYQASKGPRNLYEPRYQRTPAYTERTSAHGEDTANLVVRIRDYVPMTQIMATQPPGSDVHTSRFVAERMPADSLKRALAQRKSDGTPLHNQRFIKSLQAMGLPTADGVDISLSPPIPLDTIARVQVQRLERDLKKDMGVATRSQTERDSIYAGDRAALAWSMIATALAGLSLIPLPTATPLAGLSAIAGIMSTSAANIPQIIHAERLEDRVYYQRTYAMAVALELGGLGIGLKAGDLLDLPNDLIKAIGKKVRGKAESTLVVAQTTTERQAKAAAQAAAEEAAKKADLVDFQLARINQGTRQHSPHWFRHWVLKHPGRWKRIMEDAIGESLAPMIVGTAIMKGSDFVEFMASFDREAFHLEAERRVARTEPTAASTTVRLSRPSVYDWLIVKPGERYVVDRMRLPVADEKPGDRRFEYRRVPTSVMPRNADDAAPSPAVIGSGNRWTYTLNPDDRWIEADYKEILGSGIYRFIGTTLYKRAATDADKDPDRNARLGVYLIEHRNGALQERLVSAYGHPVPEDVQTEGANEADPLKRKAFFKKVVDDGKYFPRHTPTQLRQQANGKLLQQAINQATIVDSQSSALAARIEADSRFGNTEPGTSGASEWVAGQLNQLTKARMRLEDLQKASSSIVVMAMADDKLDKDGKRYQNLIEELGATRRRLIHLEYESEEILAHNSQLGSVWKENRAVYQLSLDLKKDDTIKLDVVEKIRRNRAELTAANNADYSGNSNGSSWSTKSRRDKAVNKINRAFWELLKQQTAVDKRRTSLRAQLDQAKQRRTDASEVLPDTLKPVVARLTWAT